MRSFFGVFVFTFFLASAGKSQIFSQLSFKTLNGDTTQLSTFNGKKVLFVILPLSSVDPVYNQLINFKNRYLDTLNIVGVLSIEDGYEPSNNSSIQSLYNGTGIVITEGMYTKKSSGSSQSILMRWLTIKEHNNHFDMDSRGIGHKFFVTGNGRLFAVMPPNTSFNSPIIDRIVHSGN